MHKYLKCLDLFVHYLMINLAIIKGKKCKKKCVPYLTPERTQHHIK
jgi:hypothetical protein